MTALAEEKTRSVERALEKKMPMISKRVQFDLDHTEIINHVVS